MKSGDTVYLIENEAKTPVVIVDKWTTFAAVRVIATGERLTKSLMLLEEIENEEAGANNPGNKRQS